MLKNCAVDFVEICNVCARKVVIKGAKRIFNSDKICRSYCDFYFGVTFFGTHCIHFSSDLTLAPDTKNCHVIKFYKIRVKSNSLSAAELLMI